MNKKEKVSTKKDRSYFQKQVKKRLRSQKGEGKEVIKKPRGIGIAITTKEGLVAQVVRALH